MRHNAKEGKMITDKDTIMNLAFLCKTYDGANKLITATKNRLQALNPKARPEHWNTINKMENLKGRLERSIRIELEMWPVWTEWAQKIPGIGGYLGGNLIMLYYYRLVPLCGICGRALSIQENEEGKSGWRCECGKTSKGEGLFKYEIQIKDFKNISSWWHYMGSHPDENGKVPKRKAGAKIDWNNKGRAIRWQVSDQFRRQAKNGHKYRAFYDKEKARLTKQFEGELTKGHIEARSLLHTGKLFLAHWWTVARTLDGLPVTEPYAGTIMGHTGIIKPFYWES
jgi:hypothetical protein